MGNAEKTFKPTFASDQNFLDQRYSKDGRPYGPVRFKEIVKECWYISDATHTSYTDVLDISFQERVYLIECINGKHEETKRAMDTAIIEAQQRNHK